MGGSRTSGNERGTGRTFCGPSDRTVADKANESWTALERFLRRTFPLSKRAKPFCSENSNFDWRKTMLVDSLLGSPWRMHDERRGCDDHPGSFPLEIAKLDPEPFGSQIWADLTCAVLSRATNAAIGIVCSLAVCFVPHPGRVFPFWFSL